MSLIEKGRVLAARAMAKHGVRATLTRTAKVQTKADRDAGRTGSTVATITGRGPLGSREVKLADGTIRQESTATLDIAPVKGDVLTIGTRAFEVLTVEEVNPAGEATAIIYRVTLK